MKTTKNHEIATWSVWRQDDNSNEVIMASNLSEEEATAMVKDFEARGHKQIYWIKQDSTEEVR